MAVNLRKLIYLLLCLSINGLYPMDNDVSPSERAQLIVNKDAERKRLGLDSQSENSSVNESENLVTPFLSASEGGSIESYEATAALAQDLSIDILPGRFFSLLNCLNPLQVINKLNPLRIIPSDIVYWNWKAIDIERENFLDTLSFPDDFKLGVADSAYQVEGPYYYDDKIAENNWTEWEEGTFDDGRPHIAEGQRVGRACDRWNRYEDDIKLMADCGVKIYRFSIEWSKIEPQLGVFDEKSMQHYVDLAAKLKEYGIEPVACLFHHTWPGWFDRLGAWEHKRDIEYFVEYARYVFEALHDKVTIWMTINEPVGFAMGSYYIAHNPPGKKDLTLCGKVVANLLRTHCECYKAFKKIDPKCQVGFPHVIQPIDPYHRFNLVERIGASIFDYLVNEATIDYFRTGEFKWGYPWKSMVYDYNEDAPQCLDYIGVNYYSHTNVCMRWKKILNMKEFVTPQPRADKQEIVTDNKQVIYPEGLYRAIARCAKLKKPMYVTENGVADNDDKFKNRYIKSHLYATSKAIEDGFDVRGYFYWTLMRNWEWSEGYTQNFGLFNVNVKTQERIPQQGAQEFIEFMRKNKNKN